jgi:hypothetical protein
MTSDETPSGKKWDRASLLRALTSAEAQVVASAGTGLLVWSDVISVKVPLYFFKEAALVVKEAVSFVVTEVAHIIPNIFDGIERNTFSVADAAHIVVIAAVIYLGFTFFKRNLQALKKISPLHWNLWPRFGLRRKLLLIALLAAGIFAAWQLDAFPQIASQFRTLGDQIVSQLSFENLSAVNQWLWQGIVAAYENKETVLPVVKGALAAVATYATLEAARVTAHFVAPPIRLGYAVCIGVYPWLPAVSLSQRQKDWLHAASSVTGGLIFGFSNLSFPSVPLWVWAASAPGLFLFARERPDLIPAISKVGWNLGRCFRTVAEFVLARPKWAGGIAAGFMVGIAAAGALSASRPLLGFAIMSGAIKAAYTGTVIAVLIAAGRGSAALVARTRRATSHLTMRARELRRDLLWAAAKMTEPVVKLGKAALILTSRSKTETSEREQVRDTTPQHAHDHNLDRQSSR